MTVEDTLKLLGVAEGASFDEILHAKNVVLASCKDDQDVVAQARDVPFSATTKQFFDVVVLSKNMGSSFISLQHLAIALFTLDDPTTNILLQSSPIGHLLGSHVSPQIGGIASPPIGWSHNNCHFLLSTQRPWLSKNPAATQCA
ncbi:Chaperone protein ClpD1, chloroplastic [Zea mays]|uniref:Chaperone protein ClpD1, chloroplastic n=1 Tax=Zea mays TaxID=4577 RepID=A0A3L6FMZ6_MAIZE|nr:Chaperone protein ClpD1, chloroplastic [Zea mays]